MRMRMGVRSRDFMRVMCGRNWVGVGLGTLYMVGF